MHSPVLKTWKIKGKSMSKAAASEVKSNNTPLNLTSSRPVAKEKPNYEYMRDKDREMVKGIFHFYEVPGGTLEFCHKVYKGDEVTVWKMKDGEIRSVPLGVAKHLCKSGKYPVHAHTMDKDGVPIMKIGTKVARYSFQSLEFVDMDDFGIHEGKEIITVERATGF
jgi:hypothetical protein